MLNALMLVAFGFTSNLVGGIVLSQFLGPPLLRHALRESGEAGRSIPSDRLVEQLTRRLVAANATAAAAISAAATAAAAQFASPSGGRAASRTSIGARDEKLTSPSSGVVVPE